METQPISGQPQYVIAQPARRWSFWQVILTMLLLAGAAFLALIMLMIVGMVFYVAQGEVTELEEEHHSLAENGVNKIAIINVEGTILDGDTFVKKQIDQIRDDEDVKGVVLRIDSPGGTITGSDYLYHHLVKLKTEREMPIVVSMGGMAASGGYYIAMAVGDQEKSIYAEPTTWTGSIGVVIPHYSVAGLMEKWQIEEDSIKSHPLKQMGSPFKTMTEEERAIFQALVDDSFTRFKEIIKTGRPKFREDPAALDKLATGQIFTTNQALESGLVDQQGFVEDAVDRVLELAKLDRGTTEVIEYEQPASFFDLGLVAESKLSQPNLKTLLDLATPRGYYLFTSLPVAKIEE